MRHLAEGDEEGAGVKTTVASVRNGEHAMKIPPGVSAGDFAEAIKQFEEAVGKEWVFTSDEDVALYRDAYSPFWGEEEELVASAAVAPDNVEQVQKVVRIANKFKIPLYTDFDR